MGELVSRGVGRTREASGARSVEGGFRRPGSSLKVMFVSVVAFEVIFPCLFSFSTLGRLEALPSASVLPAARSVPRARGAPDVTRSAWGWLVGQVPSCVILGDSRGVVVIPDIPVALVE
jgi:hypothetical protein